MRLLVAAMRVVSESHGICVNWSYSNSFSFWRKDFSSWKRKALNPLLISLVLSKRI